MEDHKIAELRDEAGKSLAEMRELIVANPEGFDSETAQKFDRIEADHDAKRKAADAAERVGAMEATQAEARALALPAVDAVDVDSSVRSAPVNPLDTAEYREAFGRVIRGDVDAETRAAMAKGSASTGGYLVPESWGNELITSLVSQSPMLAKARQFVTSSGEFLHIPVVNFDSATAPLNQPNLKAAAINEAGAYAETEDTVSEVKFAAYKFGTVAKVSDELLRDSLFNVDGLIREQAAKTLGYTIGSNVATGSGSSTVQGYNNATVGVTAASATAFTASELITLQHKIGVPYRTNAEWYMSDSALAAARKLVDSNGRFLLEWNAANGAPATILGRPVNVDPFLPTVATGNKHTVYGDASVGYGIRRVAGINVKVLYDLYAGNGQVGYRLDVSLDGKLLDSAALTTFQQA